MFAAALLALALLPQAPAAPDLTLPPEAAQTRFITEGRGVQIYRCTSTADGVYAWKFEAPEAQLFNLATGQPMGTHGAGPTWTLTDGTTVKGLVVGTRPFSRTNIPWLLLRAQPVSGTPAQGGDASGKAPIAFVRRYNTQGGVAPEAGCDAAHRDVTVRIPYTANYAFYGLRP